MQFEFQHKDAMTPIIVSGLNVSEQFFTTTFLKSNSAFVRFQDSENRSVSSLSTFQKKLEMFRSTVCSVISIAGVAGWV